MLPQEAVAREPGGRMPRDFAFTRAPTVPVPSSGMLERSTRGHTVAFEVES
jgi:hypothetical protein